MGNPTLVGNNHPFPSVPKVQKEVTLASPSVQSGHNVPGPWNLGSQGIGDIYFTPTPLETRRGRSDFEHSPIEPASFSCRWFRLSPFATKKMLSHPSFRFSYKSSRSGVLRIFYLHLKIDWGRGGAYKGSFGWI